MSKKSEKIVKVKVTFTKRLEGGFSAQEECAEIGFRGGYYSPTMVLPSLSRAAEGIMAFNDETKQGLSGRGCSGKIIQEGPDKWIYEIDARLSQF